MKKGFVEIGRGGGKNVDVYAWFHEKTKTKKNSLDF